MMDRFHLRCGCLRLFLAVLALMIAEPIAKAQSLAAGSAPTPADLCETWERYLAEFGETVCEVRSESHIGETLDALKKDDSVIDIVTSRALTEGYLVETVYLSRTTNQVRFSQIRGSNANYAFSLTRKKDGAIELWELDAESSREHRMRNFEGSQHARGFVEGPFTTSVYDLTLLQVLRHPSLRTKGMTETVEGDWQLEFDCEVRGPDLQVFHGPAKLVVQRAGHQLPISLFGRVSSGRCKSTTAISFEYADALGLSRMSRYRYAVQHVCGEEKSAGELTLMFTWRRPTEEDRKTLYFSHYGLPEPKKPSRINWWIMLGGALLLAGAYRLISRREQWARK